MKLDKFIRSVRGEPTVCFAARDENLSPGARYGPVMRDCYLVECCLGGKGSLIIENREFPLSRGVCAIVPPGVGVVHTADLKEPRRGVWCAIDGLQVGAALARVGISKEKPYAPKEAFEEICLAVEQMIDAEGETDPGADMRRTAMVYTLLGALLRHSTVRDCSAIIERAIGFMETEYYRTLSVKEIAAAVGLDRSYFSTMFKAGTGVSPHAYLASLRVRKAAALMRDGGYSVSEAAAAVGLDPRNFARQFRRLQGVTPKNYAKGEKTFTRSCGE